MDKLKIREREKNELLGRIGEIRVDGPSDSSDESDDDSIFSGVSYSTDASSAPSSHASRVSYRSRVFVDSTKKEVTPYDGGKTTVLTGGVMLGALAPTQEASGKWRK